MQCPRCKSTKLYEHPTMHVSYRKCTDCGHTFRPHECDDGYIRYGTQNHRACPDCKEEE